MPFVFRCRRCGTILYEDPHPVLDIGSYKRQTYLEAVLTKLGGKCLCCNHLLQIPPQEIEVFASKNEMARVRKRRK